MGDVGIGFPGSPYFDIPDNAFFIKGNHDNPVRVNMHPNYLGDWGSKIIEGKKVFWVGGAWSIDWQMRTEGVSWWRNEELDLVQFSEAHDAYVEFKPDIMLTHDFPEEVGIAILKRFDIPGFKSPEPQIFKTRTGQALQAMFEAYQPKEWWGGHWHVSWTKNINGTQFRCLNELEYAQI